MSKATVVYQGGQTTYNFPFDYLAKAFVKVAYIHVDGTIQTLNYGVDYKVVDKSIVCTLMSVATDRVKIYRETSTSQIVTFVDSSILRSKDLNALDVQLLHISEESMDRVDDAGLSKDEADGKWNAKQAIIKNVADGVSQYDAVNRGQLDTIAGSTSAAAASAAAAHQSELNASASSNSAGVSASNSASSAATAASSANSAHNSEVNAAASATAAASSASQAETLKNQTATLEGQTQVLHDDTKVMHDEVMTATPSRCLPLTGGTVSGSITANDGFYGHLYGTADNATHATTADSATTAANATHATTVDVTSSTADNTQIVNLAALRAQTRPVTLWTGTASGSTFTIAADWTPYNILEISFTNAVGNSACTDFLMRTALNGADNPSNCRVWINGQDSASDSLWIVPNPNVTNSLTFGCSNATNTVVRAIRGLNY